MTVTLFHNPDCSKSRRTLELIREQGIEPRIVDYLQAGWTIEELSRLLHRMQAGPRAILRAGESGAIELDLAHPGTSDAAILAAMAADPVLVERPILETSKGVRVCRPPETCLDLL